jgi:hypothetical protein
VTSASARKGRRAEIAVAEYLASAGWPYAEPTRRSGWRDDRGDIDGIPGVVVEVKNQQRHDLPGWLRELANEIDNAKAETGVLVVKRRGTADAAQWYAIMPLYDWASMAKAAGW